MINTEQKQKIQEALNFYQDEIYDNDEFDNSYISDEAVENDIKERAKEKLTDNLEGFELLDINLDDFALVEQEKEIVNYIENEL